MVYRIAMLISVALSSAAIYNSEILPLYMHSSIACGYLQLSATKVPIATHLVLYDLLNNITLPCQ